MYIYIPYLNELKITNMSSKCADYVNLMDGNGWTPLIFAINNNHFDMCKYLLDLGACIYLRNEDGDSPITLANKQDALGICDLLQNSESVHDPECANHAKYA